MRRHVWGNRVISHFAVPWQNLLSLNPPPPRKTSPKNSGCGKPLAQGRRSKKKKRSLFPLLALFSQMPPIVWGEQRKSVSLTVDFGNQRWVSARRKLLRTQAPISGTDALLPALISKSLVLLWFFVEAVRFSSQSFLKMGSFLQAGSVH